MEKDLILAIYSIKDCLDLLYDIVEEQEDSINELAESIGLYPGFGNRKKISQIYENIKALRATVGRIQNEANPTS